MKANCIDLSTWNGAVNFTAVKSSGITAAILRAGFGREVSQIDNRFEEYYFAAVKAGLQVGVYWYSYAESVADAEKEARACLAILNGRKLNLPVYFDMEESWQTKLGRTTLTAMAERFCETIKAGGYSAGVYSNANWFSNYLDYNYLKARYSIWLAQWASFHSYDCDIWQFSDSGSINGINGNVDLNVILSTPSGSTVQPPTATQVTQTTPSVATVQNWLNTYYKAGLEVDGIYGRLTKAAHIRALQTELNKQYGAGLVVDGIFGVKTKAAVRNLSQGSTGRLVSILQGLLLCNGYASGGFDGIFGIGTKSAVISYQYEHGLVTDGIAGRETFGKLCG